MGKLSSDALIFTTKQAIVIKLALYPRSSLHIFALSGPNMEVMLGYYQYPPHHLSI